MYNHYLTLRLWALLHEHCPTLLYVFILYYFKSPLLYWFYYYTIARRNKLLKNENGILACLVADFKYCCSKLCENCGLKSVIKTCV